MKSWDFNEVVINSAVLLEEGYRPATDVCVVRNLPFTAGDSALIYTQTLIKDKRACRLLSLTQAPLSKCSLEMFWNPCNRLVLGSRLH